MNSLFKHSLQLLILYVISQTISASPSFDGCSSIEFKIAEANHLPIYATSLGKDRFVTFFQVENNLSAVILENTPPLKPIAKFTIDKKSPQNALPSAVYIGDDTFVVAWQRMYTEASEVIRFRIWGQLFSVSGEKIGDEFLISGEDEEDAWYGSLAHVEPGILGASWTSRVNNDGIIKSSYFLIKSGKRIGKVLTVNDCGCFQMQTRVTAVQEQLITTWKREQATYQKILARGSKSDSTLVGDLISVDFGYTWSQQMSPIITTLSDSKYVIVWASQRRDMPDFDIRAQIIQHTDEKVGNEVIVNPNSSYTLHGYDIPPGLVAINSGKEFVVAWQHQERGGNFTLYGQVVSANGKLVEEQFELTPKSSSNSNNMVLVSLDENKFAVVFQRENERGTMDVFARVLDQSCISA